MNKKLQEAINKLIPTGLSEEDTEFCQEAIIRQLQGVPRCNKCGGVSEEKRWGTISAKIHWGYESTGKDTDCDKWHLCEKCTKEFESQFKPLCSMCLKPITEVMADLAHRNPRCSFYGDYDSALKHYLMDNHCGLEYAQVSARNICEMCYEDFTASFKIPIPNAHYGIMSGDYSPGEGDQRKGRIEEAFTYKMGSSATATYYEDLLDFKHTVEARKVNPDIRAISLCYKETKPEWAEQLKTKKIWKEDNVTLRVGNGEYIYIPISWLKEQAVLAEKSLDLKNPKILQEGYSFSLGELTFSSAVVISNWLEQSKIENEPFDS